MSITVTNDVHVNVEIEGQDDVKALHQVLDYGLNNIPASEIASDKVETLNQLRLQLHAVFQ